MTDPLLIGQNTRVDNISNGNPSHRTTPIPFALDPDYMNILKEAQRDASTISSARVSPLPSAMLSVSSTSKNTPSTSPKSPPNSPNVDLAYFDDLKEELKSKGVFINKGPEPNMDDVLRKEWSSSPKLMPPRGWGTTGASTVNHRWRGSNRLEERKTSWNKDVLCILFSSNAISLTIGFGLGYWLFKRGSV